MIQRFSPTQDLLVDFYFDKKLCNYITVDYYTDGAYIYTVTVLEHGNELNDFIHLKIALPAQELQQMHGGQLNSTIKYGYDNQLFPDLVYDRSKTDHFDIWINNITPDVPYDYLEEKVNQIIEPLEQRVEALERGGGSGYDDTELRNRITTLEAEQVDDDGRLTAIENNIDDMYLKGEVDEKFNDYNPTSNFKTINGNSLIGEGNIQIGEGGSSYDDSELRGRIETLEDKEDGILSQLNDKANIWDLYVFNPTNNFKTINGNSIIGEGNITIEGGDVQLKTIGGNDIKGEGNIDTLSGPITIDGHRAEDDTALTVIGDSEGTGSIAEFKLYGDSYKPLSILKRLGHYYISASHGTGTKGSLSIYGDNLTFATDTITYPNAEIWTFELEDGTTVEKKMILSN